MILSMRCSRRKKGRATELGVICDVSIYTHFLHRRRLSLKVVAQPAGMDPSLARTQTGT